LAASAARRHWPAEIIPIIERTDLIFGVDAWVLNEACRQLSLWRGAGLAEDVSICVNLSAKQLKAADILQAVDCALAETGAEPQALVLEITETILIDDIEASVALLRSLRGKGVRVATDDFGTGFSSLCYLQRPPIDTGRPTELLYARSRRTPATPRSPRRSSSWARPSAQVAKRIDYRLSTVR
jgi:EAL domain-containing protein (putative c-di-GMP-specific phosphodiesterase class I)